MNHLPLILTWKLIEKQQKNCQSVIFDDFSSSTENNEYVYLELYVLYTRTIPWDKNYIRRWTFTYLLLVLPTVVFEEFLLKPPPYMDVGGELPEIPPGW